MSKGASCTSCIWAWPVGIPGSVTITEGRTPSFDVATAANPVVLGLDVDEVTAALLPAGDLVEDNTAALLATLADVRVWKVDICTVDTEAAWVAFAAIGNAAEGHRHEQSQGSDATREGAAAAFSTVDSDVPAVALELGVVDATDAVVST